MVWKFTKAGDKLLTKQIRDPKQNTHCCTLSTNRRAAHRGKHTAVLLLLGVSSSENGTKRKQAVN